MPDAAVFDVHTANKLNKIIILSAIYNLAEGSTDVYPARVTIGMKIVFFVQTKNHSAPPRTFLTRYILDPALFLPKPEVATEEL